MPVAAGCTGGSSDPEVGPTKPASQKPVVLTFGVYGPDAALAAFASTVSVWNATTEGPEVKLRTWESRDRMRAALESGVPVPDVFLAPRADLRWLLDNGYAQPVDELLDERGVNFGDGYSRDALQAFSAEDRLQCMPYAVSPMVIYYNRELVNFERMRNRGLDAPDEDATSWSFEQFAAAAEFASRPRRDTKGVHISASLSGLGPFIESGGGSVFDDAVDPTSLTFSSDDSQGALERSLELLRNPNVTLDEDQLAEASPLQWFERGKLGMIAGYRQMVPQLRLVQGLDFDVMPMPVLDSSATVGDVTGLCLSRKAASTSAAADFMVYQLSVDAVTRVTRTGYLLPANLEVALTDAFLQPGRMPDHAVFFNNAIRSMRLAPMIDNLPELEEAVQPSLDQLVYGVGVLDLDAVTQEIDETSRTVLDPESVSESPSPSESDAE
ncbi:ABC transporter substrate-binding protein [Nocardioides caricicola]|uniref:ABC transporter substrate-binding protein n=1 Tax=Nocardioides caricicola TaxID=634770 RepID=A0ABW0N519_9ACTN